MGLSKNERSPIGGAERTDGHTRRALYVPYLFIRGRGTRFCCCSLPKRSHEGTWRKRCGNGCCISFAVLRVTMLVVLVILMVAPSAVIRTPEQYIAQIAVQSEMEPVRLMVAPSAVIRTPEQYIAQIAVQSGIRTCRSEVMRHYPCGAEAVGRVRSAKLPY